jgi:hypothetical protein
LLYQAKNIALAIDGLVERSERLTTLITSIALQSTRKSLEGIDELQVMLQQRATGKVLKQ